jgi:hypothetical protein
MAPVLLFDGHHAQVNSQYQRLLALNLWIAGHPEGGLRD